MKSFFKFRTTFPIKTRWALRRLLARQHLSVASIDRLPPQEFHEYTQGQWLGCIALHRRRTTADPTGKTSLKGPSQIIRFWDSRSLPWPPDGIPKDQIVLVQASNRRR